MDGPVDYVRLGEWCGTLLWGVVPLGFVIAAIRARARSMRLANLSLAFGFLCLFMIEARLGISPVRTAGAYQVAACLRGLLGLGGMALGVLALRARVTDGACGIGRACTGIVVSALHLVVGVGMLVTSRKMEADVALIREFAARQPAVAPVPAPRLALALPSAGWEQRPPSEGEVAQFEHPYAPRASLAVHLVREQANRQDYDEYLQEEARFAQGLKGRCGAPREERGRTPAGNPCRYLWVPWKNGQGVDCETVLASLWLPGKGVVAMTFDRPVTALSETMRTAEAEWIRREVKRILESAK